jgi:hypothetical protein
MFQGLDLNLLLKMSACYLRHEFYPRCPNPQTIRTTPPYTQFSPLLSQSPNNPHYPSPHTVRITCWLLCVSSVEVSKHQYVFKFNYSLLSTPHNVSPTDSKINTANVHGVSKTFGEWYQKTKKTEDTNKLTLLAFKIIAILHNKLLATFIKLL